MASESETSESHVYSMPSADGGDFGPIVHEEHRRKPKMTSLSQLMAKMNHEFENDIAPVRWSLSDETWGNFYFRPNAMITIGGATNVGKTSLALDSLRQAMKATPGLRVLMANNESQPIEILNRLTAMELEINLRHIRARDRVQCPATQRAAANKAMESLGERLNILEPPFTLEDVIELAEDFRADVVCIDVLQKLRLRSFQGDAGDTVGRIMPMLRDLANCGPCVLCISSVSREGVRHLQKRVGRRDHDELDACVFLHNSEIESSTDDAYVLLAEPGTQTAVGLDEVYTPIPMWLQHLKSRDDMRVHVPLLFDGRYQRFSLRTPAEKPRQNVNTALQGASAARASVTGTKGKRFLKPSGEGPSDDHVWLR